MQQIRQFIYLFTIKNIQIKLLFSFFFTRRQCLRTTALPSKAPSYQQNKQKGKMEEKGGKSLWQGSLLGSWPALSGAKVICQLAVSTKLFLTKSQERSKVKDGR
jgi:hypothetical protein